MLNQEVALMITKLSQSKINELICALSERAAKAVASGGDIPLNAIDSLSRLVEVSSGGAPEGNAPVCGFIVPSQEEADEE